MKRRTLLLLCCCLFLLFPFSASAHPGRTDANGGHYDSSTGEYHYHHGYPAHQHTNGVCPYDFDNKTGQNSGSSSSSKSSSVSTYPTSSISYSASDLSVAASNAYDDGYTAGHENGYKEGYTTGEKSGLETNNNKWLGSFAALIVIAAVIIIYLLNRQSHIKDENSALHSHIREYRDQTDDANQKARDWEHKYHQCRAETEAARKEDEAALSLEKEKISLLESSALYKSQCCDQFISTLGPNAEAYFKSKNAAEHLSKMEADYLTLVYEASAVYLTGKKRPALAEAYRIRKLKDMTKEWIERAKRAEYENEQLKQEIQQLRSSAPSDQTNLLDWLDHREDEPPKHQKEDTSSDAVSSETINNIDALLELIQKE